MLEIHYSRVMIGLVGLILFAGAAACAEQPVQADAGPPVYKVEVLERHPHDRGAYTQGLVIQEGKLYEGTGGYGESSLRLVDMSTGRSERMHRLGRQYFGEGIVPWGKRIVQLTWRSRTAFVYDRDTFRPLGTFNYEGEGWGLTHDGKRLILSDGTEALRFIDPKTLKVVETKRVTAKGRPVRNLNELEYVDGLVLANIWQTDRIACIDPATGDVVAWLDLTGLFPPERRRSNEEVLNGIAYDADAHKLYVTGKRWPELFEIRPLVPTGGWYSRVTEARAAAEQAERDDAPSP